MFDTDDDCMRGYMMCDQCTCSGVDTDDSLSRFLYVSDSHASSSSLSTILVKTTAWIVLKSGSDIYVDDPPTFPSASDVVYVCYLE